MVKFISGMLTGAFLLAGAVFIAYYPTSPQAQVNRCVSTMWDEHREELEAELKKPYVQEMLKMRNLTVEQAVEERCKELIREGAKF